MKRPLSAIAIVATLSLGIGATTAIFAVIEGVLLEPLPYPESDRLLLVLESNPGMGRPIASMSAPNYAGFRDRNQTLESLVLTRTMSRNLVGEGDAERLLGIGVSGEFFQMLRLEPMIGRPLVPADDLPGAAKVVVLGHGLWQRRFGGDPGVEGRVIDLSGEPYQVVGVLPPDCYPVPRDFFIPLQLDYANADGIRAYFPLARLRDGATIDAARADLETVAAALDAESASTDKGWTVAIMPWHEWYVRKTRPALLLLLAAVGVVLLVAGVNTANLLLERLARRENELAVRAALGAGPGDLTRVVMLESLLLTLIAGGLAVGVAAWGLDLLLGAYAGTLPETSRVGVDFEVLLFVLAVSIAVGLLIGLVPAWRASRPELRQALAEGGGATTGVRRRRLRTAFVVVEVALGVVLLVAAALLLRGFDRLAESDTGVDSENVLTAKLELDARYTDDASKLAFYRQLDEGLRALPGTRASGVVSHLPLTPFGLSTGFYIDGRPFPQGDDWPVCAVRAITPGYLEAMDIPLLDGRGFDGRDNEGAVPVALISETAARKHWPGKSPIGQRLHVVLASETEPTLWREIVGVVGDIAENELGSEFQENPELYLPMRQQPSPTAALVVRAVGDPAALAAPLRELVGRLDPNLPVYEVRPMEAVVDEALADARFNTLLVGVFAALALVLVAIGVYGVIAYGVEQRRRELAVRQAFGADGGRIVGLVVRQGMASVALGFAVGVAGALLSARWLRGQIYGVGMGDPVVWAAVVALVAVVALAACFIPARRAVRIDPWTVLREE